MPSGRKFESLPFYSNDESKDDIFLYFLQFQKTRSPNSKSAYFLHCSLEFGGADISGL